MHDDYRTVGFAGGTTGMEGGKLTDNCGGLNDALRDEEGALFRRSSDWTTEF